MTKASVSNRSGATKGTSEFIKEIYPVTILRANTHLIQAACPSRPTHYIPLQNATRIGRRERRNDGGSGRGHVPEARLNARACHSLCVGGSYTTGMRRGTCRTSDGRGSLWR